MDDNSSLSQEKDDKEQDEKELGSSELTKFYSSLGSPNSTHKVELISLPISYLHVMMDEEFPQCINLPEINSAIFLPTSVECRKSIEAELNSSGKQKLQNDVECNVSLICHPCTDPETVIQDLTQGMRRRMTQNQPSTSGENRSTIGDVSDQNSPHASGSQMYDSVNDNAWFNAQESPQNCQSVKCQTDPSGEDQS